MYIILTGYIDKLKGQENFYHKIIVPILFVCLWVAGLAFTIIDSKLPTTVLSEDFPVLLRGLVYIYFIFIVEVVVTFTDIHYVYRLYNAKKLLYHVLLCTILPNVLLTIANLVWFYYHPDIVWLVPFVFLSGYIKYKEVWMANNGDILFAKQQSELNKDFIFRPQQTS